MKKMFILLIFVLLSVPVASAMQGSMTLLTVVEKGNETVGGTANVHLEIKPGTGRIFMDSFPLTNIDTQASTRYAQQIACDFLERDCSNLDFFYTIRARSNIVGGPSAGGAITVLTISLLEGIVPNENVIMTGTINSGGIIGPVAGIEEKVKAAKDKGFKTVLIPKWSVVTSTEELLEFLNSTDNQTFNLSYADNFTLDGIEIKSISTLEEALKEFIGKEYETSNKELVIPEEYQNIMKRVAEQLCNRYYSIKSEIPVYSLNQSVLNLTEYQMNLSNHSLQNADYYSAASFCFTANSGIRAMQLQNYSNSSKEIMVKDIEKKAKDLLNDLSNRELNTISDLETYIIVKERLVETLTLLEDNQTVIYYNLGYITERFYSAVAWSQFFEYSGEEVILSDEHLSSACLSKISETEERLSYYEYLFGYNEKYHDDLSEIKNQQKDGDYAFCLFKASKLKADINAVLSTLALTEEKVEELILDKLNLAKKQIMNQGDTFPILGFSYYNYAGSLIESRPYLSLVFSEYASDLSNLKLYFPKKKEFSLNVNPEVAFPFFFGLFLGIFVTFIVLIRKRSYRSSKKK